MFGGGGINAVGDKPWKEGEGVGFELTILEHVDETGFAIESVEDDVFEDTTVGEIDARVGMTERHHVGGGGAQGGDGEEQGEERGPQASGGGELHGEGWDREKTDWVPAW